MHKMLLHLIKLLERPEKKRLKRLAALSLLSPILDLFGVSMLIPILNEAIGKPVTTELMLKVIGLGMIFVIKGGLELAKSKLSNALSSDSANVWSVKIYELYTKESLHDHNQKSAMQAIAGVRGDTTICAGMIVTSLSLAADLLVLIGFFAVLIYIAGWIGVATCLMLALFAMALYWKSKKNMTRYGKEKRQLEIKANGLTSTAFGAYKEVKIDTRKQNMLKRYEKTSTDCAKIQKDYAFALEMLSIILQNVMQVLIIFLLAIVLAMGVDLTGIVAQAAVYITILVRMIPGTKTIVSALNNIRYGGKYYEVFKENMDRYAAMKDAEAQEETLREKRITLTKGIRIENMTFRYPGGKEIFKNTSLELLAGSSIAVIGPSGVGKTTFLDLILGLLTPQAGHIWYDDFDIVDRKDKEGPCNGNLGAIVSYIPQTVYLDGETIRNNVVFMADEGEADEKRIVESLKCAQIWQDVAEMPEGVDTLIGQDGTRVSGGQRQRIALARALYKDFDLLIMDEATAALDKDTEKAVIDSIRQIKGNKTLLMVTHHLRLANECEYIYKIQNKKLVRVR